MKDALLKLIKRAVDEVVAEFLSAEQDRPPYQVALDVPRHDGHGDYSTNIALKLAKPLAAKPMVLAEAIVARMASDPVLLRAETAAPGFINLHVATARFLDVVATVLEAGERYGESDIGLGKRVQIEFVSANPTGPLHVGHGRGAAYGAVLANLFSVTGHEVSREYYVNDAGRQMDILALSVWIRYGQAGGADPSLPTGAYQGDYIRHLADQFRNKYGDTYLAETAPVETAHIDPDGELDLLISQCKETLGAARYATLHEFSRDAITAEIAQDLTAFRVEFDQWFFESALKERGTLARAIAKLGDGDHLYMRDGAEWFRSSAFGDEKDRVVMRENTSETYFASDIAYHLDKYERGFDHLINIWGADHHGYVARVRAAIEALGLDPQRLEILLVQFAVLYRGTEKIPMSTRTGQFVTLHDLVTEVGRDAARFYYLSRRADQHLDFDLELAKSESLDNPIYYVQYAHARICSVLRQLEDNANELDLDAGRAHIHMLDHPKEKQLATQIARYPEVVLSAMQSREPHQITTYLREFSADFQRYYDSCKILVADSELRNARLALTMATKQVLVNGLGILGISAPESM